MKKQIYPWIILLLVLSFWGCKDNSTTPVSQEIEEASDQKQFVWNAMNYWYYWQGDVPELEDSRRDDQEAFHSYLNGFSSAEALFNSLLYEADDFSFFIEDYETFGESKQGISKSFGYQFGLVRITDGEPEIMGYVQYVLPDSPAENAGLVRGDIFTSVDGTTLTVNNYQDLLQAKTSYELSLATIENGEVSETGETASMDAVTIEEDPIYYSSVIDTNATKVGYMMYNAFQSNSHDELNDAFANFQSESIDELVLDLRYNGGGSGLTSQVLGGLISGLDSSNVFSTYSYNAKRDLEYGRSVYFVEDVPVYNNDGDQVSTEAINDLGLSRVYVLTGYGTASASEVLINALEPYIEVVLIGDQTVGKDEGSYTLYDAGVPYYSNAGANPDHKIAIQPICIKLVNKNGRNYPDGFTPDHEVIEIEYLDEGLPPIGDPNEHLLAKALELITGQPMARQEKAASTDFPIGEMLMDSRDMEPYPKGLYLDNWVKN